jgi:hypothetical protein
LFCLAASLISPAAGVPAAETDLDALMRQVLLRRDDNWNKLQQYILDEREQIELRGRNHEPIWGERHEYTWYIRDGFFVRSPVKFNGVEIGEPDRRKYEAEFLRRSQDRERRSQQLGLTKPGADKSSSDGGPAAPKPGIDTPPSEAGLVAPKLGIDKAPSEGGPAVDNQESTTVDQSLDGLLKQVREPQFISSSYFLRFKFEEGKYALVGRETLDGNEVLRVEYYPANLYSDRQRRRMAGNHDPDDPKDIAIQRMMNKVALITLWVEPRAHQIVKYTFDNVDFDFLPGRWLFRLDSARASMTMSQPFPNVWMPRDLEFLVDAQVAVTRFDIRWAVEYRNYRQPDVKSKFRVGPER